MRSEANFCLSGCQPRPGVGLSLAFPTGVSHQSRTSHWLTHCDGSFDAGSRGASPFPGFLLHACSSTASVSTVTGVRCTRSCSCSARHRVIRVSMSMSDQLSCVVGDERQNSIRRLPRRRASRADLAQQIRVARRPHVQRRGPQTVRSRNALTRELNSSSSVAMTAVPAASIPVTVKTCFQRSQRLVNFLSGYSISCCFMMGQTRRTAPCSGPTRLDSPRAKIRWISEFLRSPR